MEGITLGITKADEVKKSPFSLLIETKHTELINTHIGVHDVVWVSPAENENDEELYYVATGCVGLHLDEGLIKLKAGGCFCASALKKDVRLSAYEESELLIFVNHLQYANLDAYAGGFEQLNRSIDLKDNITSRHSRKVMKYAQLLFENLPNAETKVSYDELIPAAKYHDVGKIFVSDSILKKQGILTNKEYEEMKKHAALSSEILKPVFGERVASIAGEHHERLDGSGYPNSLKDREIAYGAKIIAVADSFDAMTSQRSYSNKKEASVAAKELCSLTDEYDPEITEVLLKLVENGVFRPEQMEEMIDELDKNKL